MNQNSTKDTKDTNFELQEFDNLGFLKEGISYSTFLAQKDTLTNDTGFAPIYSNAKLFDFQHDITNWSIKKGKSAIWAGCGLGKTFMQLVWAYNVFKFTNKPVLILAPLAVAQQTKNEGKKLNIQVGIHNKDKGDYGIYITNYEQIHNVLPGDFSGIVLDESSILKNFAGKFKNKIISSFRKTKYKLCCSATPSPNDFIEIGNHADFLDICTRSEMLSTFFVHDSGETQKWRLKGHAENEFFKWLASWAVMIEKPSDIGYKDDAFILPKLKYKQHIIKTKQITSFLPKLAKTLNERRKARKESIHERCQLGADLSKGSKDPWLYWCDLNAESKLLSNLVDNSVEVTGSDKIEQKENKMIGFTEGVFQKLVTKPKIAQFGMNWQHCNNMVFVGLSDSFEAFYQAVRRCWRFGQKKPVTVHIIISEKEGNVLSNIKAKEDKAQKMLEMMVKYMGEITKEQIKNKPKIKYKPIKRVQVPEWLKE